MSHAPSATISRPPSLSPRFGLPRPPVLLPVAGLEQNLMTAAAMALTTAHVMGQVLHGHLSSEQMGELFCVHEPLVAAETAFDDKVESERDDIAKGDVVR